MFRPRMFSAAAIASAFCLMAAPAIATPEVQDNSERSAYVLCPEDTITVRVPVAEEFATEKNPYRIDNDGYVNLPIAGRWRAAGLSVKQLETELTNRLKTDYLDPQVSISVAEMHTAPDSILGAVNTPGLQRMIGRETILEGVSRAGGLRTDAGQIVTVTRRIEYGRIPLTNAKDDPTGRFSVVDLNLAPIVSGELPAENIVLQPHDVVTVSRARMIYVLGDVSKTGAFVINDKEGISTLKALAMAGGLARNSAPASARILRREPGATLRRDIPVNLSRVMKNKAEDMMLQPEDILYIPSDLTKKIATRTIEAAIGIGSSVAVFRVGN
jgi:polysaccharide export outer membrane protein